MLEDVRPAGHAAARPPEDAVPLHRPRPPGGDGEAVDVAPQVFGHLPLFPFFPFFPPSAPSPLG
jgi:hypothetical protein